LGQIEIFEHLKNEALCGRWKWVTAAQVGKQLHIRPSVVSGDLMRLARFGYLETAYAKRLQEWPGRFRIKRKYWDEKGTT
jgi:hypothetical protein